MITKSTATESVTKDSMAAAASTFNDLLGSDAMIVFNRADGLMVFKRGALYQPIKTNYYNNYQKNPVLYEQQKYTIVGNKTKCRHYTAWQLITMCLYFGDYDKETGDYVITGRYYRKDRKRKHGEYEDIR